MPLDTKVELFVIILFMKLWQILPWLKSNYCCMYPDQNLAHKIHSASCNLVWVMGSLLWLWKGALACYSRTLKENMPFCCPLCKIEACLLQSMLQWHVPKQESATFVFDPLMYFTNHQRKHMNIRKSTTATLCAIFNNSSIVKIHFTVLEAIKLTNTTTTRVVREASADCSVSAQVYRSIWGPHQHQVPESTIDDKGLCSVRLSACKHCFSLWPYNFILQSNKPH